MKKRENRFDSKFYARVYLLDALKTVLVIIIIFTIIMIITIIVIIMWTSDCARWYPLNKDRVRYDELELECMRVHRSWWSTETRDTRQDANWRLFPTVGKSPPLSANRAALNESRSQRIYGELGKLSRMFRQWCFGYSIIWEIWKRDEKVRRYFPSLSWWMQRGMDVGIVLEFYDVDRRARVSDGYLTCTSEPTGTIASEGPRVFLMKDWYCNWIAAIRGHAGLDAREECLRFMRFRRVPSG